MSKLINFIKNKLHKPKVEHTFGLKGGDVIRRYQATKKEWD